MYPDSVHRRREAPDTERGRRVKRAAAEGGRERWKVMEQAQRQSRERAMSLVSTLHQRHPKQSRTYICERVGKELGRSGRTIQRYTRSIRW